MASTQTPPPPPEQPLDPQSDSALTRSESPSRSEGHPRYQDYEHHELLSMIDDLEEERWRARVREGIWVSVILHLVIFWFIIYGPHVLFHRPYVIDPLTVLSKREKQQLTYLNLPPDALQTKPKRSDIISDQNHVAQSAHPTLDKKTLEELQAMQAAGNPAPPPAPAPQQQQAQSTPPQPSQEPPASPQPTDQAQPNAPSESRPNISQNQNAPHKSLQQQPTMSVGEMIRQAEKSAARNAANGQSGNNGAGAPNAHPGMQSGVEILSDTMGVDFGPYIRRVIQATQSSWDILIPEAARAPLFKQGEVGITFIILPDGTVKQMQLTLPSGDVSLDRAAWGGITGAAPFDPLPKQFKGPYLALRFHFLYNENPDGSSRR